MFMKSYKAVILIVANRFLFLYLIYSRRTVSIFELDAHICTFFFLPSLNQKTYIFSTGASECRERPFQICSVASGLQEPLPWVTLVPLVISYNFLNSYTSLTQGTWHDLSMSFPPQKTSHVPRAAGYWHEISKHPRLRAVLLMIQNPAALGIHERSSEIMFKPCKWPAKNCPSTRITGRFSGGVTPIEWLKSKVSTVAVFLHLGMGPRARLALVSRTAAAGTCKLGCKFVWVVYCLVGCCLGCCSTYCCFWMFCGESRKLEDLVQETRGCFVP